MIRIAETIVIFSNRFRMPLRILLIGLLTTLVACNVAHAMGDDEIRQKKALFILGDVRQSTSLRYLFSGHTANGIRSNSSHGFQENYNASLQANVLDPHVFNASLNFSVGLKQDLFYSGEQNSSTSAFRYSYMFSGYGLDRSATPFALNSYRSTDTVMSPYSPSYTTDSTGQELRAELRNALLPSTLKFTRTTLDNSGGGFDSSTVNNSYSYAATHHYKDFSASGLAVSLSESTGSFSGGAKEHSRAYAASLNNTLKWGEQHKYTLVSRAQVRNAVNRSVPQRNVNLSESFYDRLGKALDLQLSYFLANSSTIGFDNQQSESNLHKAEAVLSHRLFDSLTSRVAAKASSHELLAGTEYRYAGEGELDYTKKIPGDNRLDIRAAGVHEVVDSRLAGSHLSITDEVHTVPPPGEFIVLPLSGGILNRVESVRSSNTFVTYEEGVDYTVDFARGQVSIVVGRIATGTELRISYTVLPPTGKYANNSIFMNARVTFLAGRYSLGGAYSQHWMNLLEGPADNTLRDSSTKRLYFSGNLNPLSYLFSYTQSLVGDLETQWFEASGQYSRDSRFGRFSLAATERYSRYGATPTAEAFTENTATCSAVYLRNLFANARLTLSADAFDSRSELRGPRDIVSLRGSLQYTLNKMSLSFDGRSQWGFSRGTTTRDDTVSFDFLRYL